MCRKTRILSKRLSDITRSQIPHAYSKLIMGSHVGRISTDIIKRDNSGRQLTRAMYSGRQLTRAMYSGRQLTRAMYSGRQLTRAMYSGRQLTRAMYSGRQLTRAMYSGRQLTRAMYSGRQLTRAMYSGRQLTRAMYYLEGHAIMINNFIYLLHSWHDYSKVIIHSKQVWLVRKVMSTSMIMSTIKYIQTNSALIMKMPNAVWQT